MKLYLPIILISFPVLSCVDNLHIIFSAICHNMPEEDMKLCPYKGKVLSQNPFQAGSQVYLDLVIYKNKKTSSNMYSTIIFLTAHCSRLLLLTLDTTSQDSSPPGSILEDLFRNNRNILVLSYDAKKIQSTKLEYEKNLKMQMNTIILQCTSQ